MPHVLNTPTHDAVRLGTRQRPALYAAARALLALAIQSGKEISRQFQQHAPNRSATTEPAPLAVGRDELTGLYNRQHMLDALQRELLRADQSGQRFAAVIANLDHFAHVNDTLGRSVGNEALESFAGIAREVLRDTDILGRWDGEEFLFLVPDADPAHQSSICLQRLRATLDNAVVSIRRPALRLRFSAGVALSGPGESAERMLERAAHALQQAKHQGRDRTVIAS